MLKHPSPIELLELDIDLRMVGLWAEVVEVDESDEWSADVVDIDTYGEPWVIWEALLENFKGEEITVFLTYCNVPVNNAVGRMSQIVRQRIGIPEGWKIWHSRVIAPFTLNAMLAYALERGFRVIEAARIHFTHQPGVGVRWDWNELYLYMGLRLRWTP